MNSSEFPELDTNHKNAVIKHMNTQNPFWSFLGMELLDIRKGWAQVRLPFKKDIVQSLGVVHGGAIFSMADSAGAMAVLGMVNKNEYCMTLEMKINYMKSFESGAIVAEARCVNKGRRIGVSEVKVKNDAGDIIAQALATYMIANKKDSKS